MSDEQKIRWPTRDEAVLELVDVYLAHEASMPPDMQLSDISLVRLEAAAAEARDAEAAVDYHEAERVKLSTAYRSFYEQAKTMLHQARKVLEARFLSDVSPLVDWGFESKLSQGKLRVHFPSSTKGWRDLLDKYVAHESELPELERVTTPSFAEVMAVHQGLHDNLRARDDAKTNREAAVFARKAAVRKLRRLLRIAAMTRTELFYDGVITPELQLWGYDVVAVTPPPSDESPPEPV